MSLDLLLAAALFCLAGAMTPGPNNLMLLASGVNFGFRRTGPHMAGIVAGYAFLLLVIGLGLGRALMAWPVAFEALRIAGALYLVWLAWKVATSTGAGDQDVGARPLTFLQAAAFQWVNAKGVLVAISAVAAFTRPDALAATLGGLLSVSFLATLLSVLVWTLFGTGLRGWLADPKRARIFNWSMAALLLASLYPVLAGH